MTPTALVTLWTSLTNPHGERIETSWEQWFEKLSIPVELAQREDPRTGQRIPDKTRLPGWSAAWFEDDRRTNAAVRFITALVLDYDGGTSIEQAVTLWEPYEGFLHTTPSHQQDPQVDRFRVVLPLTRAVSASEYSGLWAWAHAHAKAEGQRLDEATKDPARLWYLPATLGPLAPFETRRFRGPRLSPDQVPTTVATATTEDEMAKRYVQRALERACEEVRAAGEGQRNAALNRAAFSLGGYVATGRIEETVVRKALSEAGGASGLSENETRKTLESGLRGGMAKPRSIPKLSVVQKNTRVDRVDEHTVERPEPPPSFRLTDYGNAERLVAQHGQDLRFCQALGWLVWDGRRWMRDETGEGMRRAKDTIRALYAEAATLPDDRRTALIEHALRSEKAARLQAMLTLAQSEKTLAMPAAAFDAEPWDFNVANGTIDLRTGELRPHRREDLLTKLAPVDYDTRAQCPLFEAFLVRILPDPEVRAFVQRFLGYALTGVIRDHVFPVFWGKGSNGKGTLVETVLHVMGDYARQLPAETLMLKHGETHPTERASLLGVRFAAASETEENRRLNEALVKQLTGGDTIAARFMRQDFFEFRPTHKLALQTNHKPVVQGTDRGIWRRLRLVPFTVEIPEEEQDKALPEKLLAESQGIFRWLVGGCLAWQREGLGEPEAVRTTTAGYRNEMDVLGMFLEERCVVARTARATSAELYRAYGGWCVAHGERAVSQRAFAEALEERGFDRARGGHAGTRLWVGLGLATDAADAADAADANSGIQS